MNKEDYTSVYMRGYYNGKDKAFEQNEQERQEYRKLLDKHKQLENIIKELRSWLEEEKNRLARECSQIYEDSLGKTRLVNEDIFNEVNKILSKLNELEGGKNE